jgi:NADH:ubiquinone oxidoreductase subunit E
VRQRGHLKKKLRKKLLGKLGPVAESDRVVVVCVGEDCASREENRAIFAEARELEAKRRDPNVRVQCFGCLKVCKKGPIVAVLPEATLFRRVRREDVGLLLDRGRGAFARKVA